MATIKITVFSPTDVANLTNPGPSGAFPAIGDEYRLRSDWSNSTHARTVTITDNDATLSGDPRESQVEDTSQQTAVVTDANGATVASGFAYAEYAFVVVGPGSAQLTIYSIFVGDTLVGYGANGPVQPGANYLITDYYQPNGSMAPSYKSFNSQSYENAPDNTITGTDRQDSLEGGTGNDTINARGGNDTISGGHGNDSLHGEDGNDTLYGDEGNDTLVGGWGDDVLYGGADADILHGQEGDDTIFGGDGDDSLRGSDGDDSLSGGAGVDTLVGGESNDTLDGGAGDDVLYGQEGNDLLRGGAGHDSLRGEDGNDTLSGDFGDDTLVGGSGDDVLYGGAGDDALYGQEGADVIYGQAGNDTIGGGTGNDFIDGAGDSDVFIVSDDGGDDTISGGGGGVDYDTLDLSRITGQAEVIYSGNEAGTVYYPNGTVEFTEVEHIIATSQDDYVDGRAAKGGADIELGAGDDTAYGTFGNDSISGGDGDDFIDSWAGRDTIDGGAGNDTVLGGSGDDLVMGGDGDDAMQGWTGNDTLYGGAGNDTIQSWEGNELLDGGDDADTFLITQGSGDDTVIGGEGGIDDDIIDLSALTGPVTVTYTDSEAGTLSDGTDSVTFSQIERVILTDTNDRVEGSLDSAGLNISAGAGDDSVYGGAGDDTVLGGAGDDLLEGAGGNDFLVGDDGDDSLDGGDGNDFLRGGLGNDHFKVSGGQDTIADFNTGNTGTLSDGDSTNNDFIDLSGYYDKLSELYADLADDNILNQSNAMNSMGEGVDYSNNAQFGSSSLRFRGASADKSSFTEENTGVVCFTSGTAIRTPSGDVLIDELRIDDLVTTLDNGPQRIRWIGRRTLDKAELHANPNLRPILVRRGILGAERDFLVSPQHGLLVGRCGDHLARAKHLAQKMPGIRVAHGKRCVTYIHLMFDAHQIVFSENTPSESFYPGPMALRMMDSGPRAELFELFPELSIAKVDKHKVSQIYGDTSREFAAKQQLAALAKR